MTIDRIRELLHEASTDDSTAAALASALASALAARNCYDDEVTALEQSLAKLRSDLRAAESELAAYMAAFSTARAREAEREAARSEKAGGRPVTLDRIRDLLHEADTAKPGYIDATWDTDLLDAALPLLRRWTDPTPITPEALVAEGWLATNRGLWVFDTNDAAWYVAFRHPPRNPVPLVELSCSGDTKYAKAHPRTMGQLNRIVDGIEGVE